MEPNNLRPSYLSMFFSGLAMALIVVTLFAIMRYGARIRAASEARWAQHLEQESREFCRKFTDATGPTSSMECAAHFLQTMKRHEKSVIERTDGIL